MPLTLQMAELEDLSDAAVPSPAAAGLGSAPPAGAEPGSLETR
jgi:hypothetical protein